MADGARQMRGGSGAGALFQPGMWDNLRLAWRLFRDPRVAPWLRAVVPLFCVLYVVSPINLISGFILGLGQLDDLGVIGLFVMMVLRLPRLAPRRIVREHLAAMGVIPPHDDTEPEPRAAPERAVDAAYRVRRQWRSRELVGRSRPAGPVARVEKGRA